MSGDGTTILLAPEAETYIENLQAFPLVDIGNLRWTQQHEFIEKLNMQACVSATANEDEYIKEFLITYDKIPILIQELITVEVWKNKVFPEFLEHDMELKVSFPVYMVLYHEATVANLLETVMYHSAACEAAEDSILDLLDYCYRKITYLISKNEAGEIPDSSEQDLESLSFADSSCLDELERQDEKLNFDICIKAVSILRYMTDHIKFLPLSVIQRLLNTHDIPLLLVMLIDCPPWTKRNGGKIKKYIDNKWQELSYEDEFQLTKIEGQVWIALFHVLMEEQCQNKYEFDEYRKNVILKLRSHLNEVLLDQMPVLSEMQRYVEQLSIMEAPSYRQALILEQIPVMQQQILKEHEGKWTKIAKKQYKTFFSNNSAASIQAQAKRLSEMYDLDMMESLIAEPPKCALCGQPATKRCSRCQNEWYCRRECQVSHWKKHKKACDLLMDVSTEFKQQRETDAAT